jgi:hypothetical protein
MSEFEESKTEHTIIQNQQKNITEPIQRKLIVECTVIIFGLLRNNLKNIVKFYTFLFFSFNCHILIHAQVTKK